MATDWNALRTEYVNGAMQYKELAEKHGLKEGTVRVRAHREGWGAERDAVKRDVTRRATESAIVDKAAQLAKFNDQDLRIAEALKGKAAGLLKAECSPADLRSLAGVFESARNLGLKALGADDAGNLPDDGEVLPVTVTIARKSARVEKVRDGGTE